MNLKRLRNNSAVSHRDVLWLRLFLATGIALFAVWHALGSVNLSGLRSTDATTAEIIQQRCSFHLVPLKWIAGNDSFDIEFRWVMAETQARIVAVLALWGLTIIAVLRACFNRNDAAKPEPAVV